jgi:beta-glucosidase
MSDVKRIDFPADFLWGTATASFQVEGSPDGDGRGKSIWDTFCDTPGKVYNGDTGKVACDHYRRYEADVDLMAELGINSYRFSLAWPRIFPDGTGATNPKGIDFYDRLIDRLLARGIAPAVTLYHWDLPQTLQDRGGWVNRDTTDVFADYAAFAFARYGDRVKRWFTHNEPWCVAFVSNLQGRHAPGNTDLATAVAVAHHMHLSHAKAVEAYRASSSGGSTGKIGPVFNMYPAVPASDSSADKAMANLADEYQNRWFLDPLYRGEYPAEVRGIFEAAGAVVPEKAGDLAYIKAQKTDFLGVNYYNRKIVRAATASEIAAGKTPHACLPYVEVIPDAAWVTDMNWEVYPTGLYDLLTRVTADYGAPELMVTESGAAFLDDKKGTADYTVDDDDRVRFVQGHIEAAKKSRDAGVNLTGFYVWSFMDNFVWARGYSKRFGLFHVDYAHGKTRSWKKSARWYQSFLAA